MFQTPHPPVAKETVRDGAGPDCARRRKSALPGLAGTSDTPLACVSKGWGEGLEEGTPGHSYPGPEALDVKLNQHD